MYRLEQSHLLYGMYGKIITKEQYGNVVYYDRSLFTFVANLETQFDLTIKRYYNGESILDDTFAFYTYETTEIKEVKFSLISAHKNMKIYQLSEINDIKNNPLNGNCIVILKNKHEKKNYTNS